jgi:hypothetical protein
LALRWGMAALGHLSDPELDGLFESVAGVELGEKELLALMRGDPRGVLRKVGGRRSVKAALEMGRTWIRATTWRGR